MIIWIQSKQICINFTTMWLLIKSVCSPNLNMLPGNLHSRKWHLGAASIQCVCTVTCRQSGMHLKTDTQNHNLIHTNRHVIYCYPYSPLLFPNTHLPRQYAAFSETQKSSPQRVTFNAKHYGWNYLVFQIMIEPIGLQGVTGTLKKLLR